VIASSQPSVDGLPGGAKHLCDAADC